MAAKFDGALKRAVLAFALAIFALGASATWPTDRQESLRAQAASAWAIYHGGEFRAPPAPPGASRESGALAALLQKAWPVPSAPNAVLAAMERAPDGHDYAALFMAADAPPPLMGEVVAHDGGASAVWSDGRRLVALYGDSDAAATLAEMRRLGR